MPQRSATGLEENLIRGLPVKVLHGSMLDFVNSLNVLLAQKDYFQIS
jgi:hypothetical protein